MKRKFFKVLGAVASTLLLAFPLAAADQARPKSVEKTTHVAQSHPIAWPPETLSGTIATIDPAQHLVIIKGSGGVPYDMVVRRSTRIESGSQRLTLDQLQSDINKNVSVRFVPERSGDIARTIQIMGQ
jgi:hypothetical protein